MSAFSNVSPERSFARMHFWENTEQSLLVKAVIHHAVGVSSMELSVYVDGKFYPQSEAKVSVFDHGLLYGDGVFEGIRAYNGRVFKLDRHLDRLYHSAKAIDLKIPHTKEEMANIILETCRRNDIREGYIRPVITRGKGDLGLDPRKCKSGPSVVVIAQPGISLYGKVYERGLKAEERLFTLYDVWSSDEAFISGTAAEIGPVVELDGRIIGDGKPGPTTKKIMKAFRDLVMTTGTPIEIAHVLSQKI